MEIKIVNGHNQFVFSNDEKEEIYDLYINHNYSQRALMRKFGCSQKPISRVLEEMGIDHSRGNLSSYKPYFINGLYNCDYEKEMKEKISYIPCKKQKYNINDYYFDNLRDPEVIYTIGFLYADGCNQKLKSITMSLEEQDGYILEKINNNIRNEYPVKFIDKSNKHDFGYTYKNQYCMTFYNNRIAEVLNLLGVTPRKSLTLKFPEWLYPDLYSHFIRGVFDGDGSLYRYNRPKSTPQYNLTITSTENMCKALVDICASYVNLLGHYYDASCHNGITRVFTISGPNAVKKFIDWMYKDATIFLQRKYDRYCDYYNINNSLIA